jgi:ankyrin repeat protein
MLTNLRDLGRNKVIEGLSLLVLVLDKQVFETFYRPHEDYSKFQLPSARDLSRVTLLHRAASYGDENTVKEILKLLHKCYKSGKHPNSNKLFLVGSEELFYCTTEKLVAPFYVAAACGHKKICRRILFFLKEIIGGNKGEQEGFVDSNIFLYTAMRDAILLGNHEMFQVILEAVKEACGQNSLLDLLKTEKEDRRFSSRFDNSILTPKKLWKTKVRFFSRMTEKRVTKICSVWCTK